MSFDGEEFRVRAAMSPTRPVPVLVSALAPRMLRVAGELTDGTILWMGNARAIETHVAPRIGAAARSAGDAARRASSPASPWRCTTTWPKPARRPRPSSPVTACCPTTGASSTSAEPTGSADAAIVGDEAAVTASIQGLFDAGATDVWAAIFPVGDDRSASRRRTRDLLAGLAA